ncbi:GDSL esterase/lipase [Nymphaea thermarum]|nr:GDSL esterase/lipase [Nymphaea thermarum]
MGGRRASLVALLLLCAGVAALGGRAADVIGVSDSSSSLNRSIACGFPAIFNFGDSNSDTGAISAAFNRIPPPNGMTYFHRPSGRPCDGLLIIDHFAQYLGIPFLHPYLDSIGAKFLQGANFAASGATVQHLNLTLFDGGLCPFSLDYQLAQFSQLQNRSSECYNEGCSYNGELPKSNVFSEALYTFDIGQNDLTNGFRKLPMNQVPVIIPGVLAQVSYTIQSLYRRGARYFWIHNTGPLGCLPLYVIYGPFTNFAKDNLGCAVYPNNVAMEFNRQLKQLVRELRTKLPLAALTYVDIYSAKYRLISQATKLGFVDPLKLCCGGGDKLIYCGYSAIVNGVEVAAPLCADPLKYVSWDGIHYSHAANQLIAKQIVDGSFSDPPIALDKACHLRMREMGGQTASLVALLLLCVGVSALGGGDSVVAQSDSSSSARCRFPAIFNFGDSNSDTGGISAAFNRTPSPNGMTYFHRPSGRPCDGLLIIDHFAQDLGFPFLHPYLDPIGAKFLQGANFAASGATVQHLNLTLFDGGISPMSLDYQLAQFAQLQDRSTECHKEGFWYEDQLPKSDIFSEALYTFDIGQNDLANGFRKLPMHQVPAIIPDILAQLSYTIQSLYRRGARYFWIHNTGPIGCLPLYVIYGPFTDVAKDKHGCSVDPNKVAVEFNRQLKELVMELRTKLPLAALTYVDVYSAKYRLITRATMLGFVEPLKFCCGRGDKLDIWVGCGKRGIVNGVEVVATTCADPSKYVNVPNLLIYVQYTDFIWFLWVILLAAKHSGLPYLNAYLDSVGSNFSHGANFATAGSTILRQNTTLFQSGFSPFSLDVQSWQFNQFKARGSVAYGKGGVYRELLPKQEIFNKSLYTFDIGQNDLTSGLFRNLSIDEVKAYIPDALAQFSDVVKGIHDQGGRSFWIHNTGPFGCLAYVLERLPVLASQIDQAGCAIPFNELAQFFNEKLNQTVVRLRKHFPHAVFTYVDVYSVKYELISQAKKNGFGNPLRACCGHGGKYNYNKNLGCGGKKKVAGRQVLVGSSCADPWRYVNWDGVHYTQAGNKFVFDHIVDGKFSDPPRPLRLACHKHI